MINKSIMGFSKTDIKKKLKLDRPFVARNYMTTNQLALVRCGENASTGIYTVSQAIVRDSDLKDVYRMLSKLSDYSGLKRKCLDAPLCIKPEKRRRIEVVSSMNVISTSSKTSKNSDIYDTKNY